MTGYGRNEAMIGDARCTIEVRSVNGRYLEFGSRVPKEWSSKEPQIRDFIRSRVDRGSVNVYIRLDETVSASSLQVNNEVAKAYVEALRRLQLDLAVGGEVTIDHVSRYDAIFTAPSSTEEVDVWPQLSVALALAVDAMDAMREREGSEMAKDLDTRLASIETGLVDVERMSAERIPLERERLRERVRQVVDDSSIDEQRMQLEIVLLADKLDVSEECVRLRSHIKHFKDDMKVGGAIGRKLNFQLQEMNREVNTIGSKSNDSAIARIVVGMKEELERMREQVQNIE